MTRPTGNPWKSLGAGPLIAPSLLACDFARVGEEIDRAVAGGADAFHVDIMDGHFVPNLSMGSGFCKSVRRYTDHALDVHLMVTDPRYYAERFAEAGADSITFHVEACGSPGDQAVEKAGAIIDYLHARGLGAGLTLRPGTPAETIAPLVARLEIVLVMTVEPGHGGQKFMNGQLDKVRAVRSMLRPDQRLEVDGGINVETAALCSAAGADVFVAGVNVFCSGDVGGAIAGLREAAVRARAGQGNR